MKRVRLAIIMPTRNRAELAIKSINSALSTYAGDDVGIVVSDNSTDGAESSILNNFAIHCDSRMVMIRPPYPLGMTAHWNFAVGAALLDQSFTHFTILTDRMLFKADSIRRVMGMLTSYPGDVLSYTYDRIYDLSLPAIFQPLPRSGKLFRIDSSKMLAMSARMALPSCLPRMLNSVAPREHLLKLMLRSGNIFSSIAPDFNFCYHTLDIADSFLFYDSSAMVNHAQGRSNGGSFSRGVVTKDSQDFIEQLGEVRMNGCAPLPDIFTVGNSIIHEYCAERNASGSSKFTEVSMNEYMDFLAAEVTRFEGVVARHDALGLLRKHGWKKTMRYRLIQWKSRLVSLTLGLLSHRFDTANDAIAYACTHRPSRSSFLPFPARGYGSEVPMCSARNERGDSEK